MSDVFPTPNSGAAGTEYQGALALERAGHRVHAVWADELSHRIGHYNLRYLLELPQSYREVMNRYLRKQDFDIVQVSQPHGYLAARDLHRSLRPALFVHRSHGFEPRVRDETAAWRRRFPEPRAWHRRLASGAMSLLLDRSNHLIARYADGHLVSASQCADYLETKLAVPRNRIGVLPQGVPDAFLRGARPIDRERLNHLLYVGQHAFFKAPIVLGRVVSRLLEQHSELSFTWVCSASQHGEATAHFQSTIRERVTMLDWMPQQRLVEVYDKHGIFLFPSFVEGFGKVFLEAMSRGLIVVAADNSGARDVISSGVDGFKVTTGDVDKMVETVGQVLTSADLAASVSAAAIRVASGYTWDQYARGCTMFYEELMVKRGSNVRLLEP